MERTTFADHGITEEPYVEEYVEKFKKRPLLAVKNPTRLPTRYTASDGTVKFHMSTTYEPHKVFTFARTEPGKRKAGAVNIVLLSGTDEVVITPKDMIKKMDIVDREESIPDPFPSDDDFDDTEPITPVKAAKLKPHVKDILDKRKKGAMVSI